MDRGSQGSLVIYRRLLSLSRFLFPCAPPSFFAAPEAAQAETEQGAEGALRGRGWAAEGAAVKGARKEKRKRERERRRLYITREPWELLSINVKKIRDFQDFLKTVCFPLGFVAFPARAVSEYYRNLRQERYFPVGRGATDRVLKKATGRRSWAQDTVVFALALTRTAPLLV